MDADAPDAAWPSATALAHDRSLHLAPGGRSIQLRAPDGNVELSIRITQEGPVLSLSGARVELVAEDTLELSAPDIAIRAGRRLDLTANADVVVRGMPIRLN